MTAADNKPIQARVVLRAATGRDQSLLVSLMQAHDLPYDCCDQSSQLPDRIADGDGPILTTEESLDETTVVAMIEALDKEPVWSHMPVILLRPSHSGRSSIADRLVDRPEVRWLTRPLNSQTLLATVRLALEARNRQNQVGVLIRDLNHANDQLTQRNRQLQQLTTQLIEAEDNERKRLAELMHDDLQQLLVGASLQAAILDKRLSHDGPERETLTRLRELIDQAHRRSRNLSHELYPTVLKDRKPDTLLRWVTENAPRFWPLKIDLNIKGELGETSGDMIRFLYRTLRELLCNAGKYARADRVAIHAARHQDQLVITLSDRGAGFDPEILDQQSTDGVGLRAIRERAEAMGCHLTITSAPGEGACFEMQLPVADNQEYLSSPPLFKAMDASSPQS